MREAAREWRRSNEEAEHVLEGLDPGRWIEVRYEGVCSDPAGQLARLCNLLGVVPRGLARDFRSAEHHVLGNGMRLDTTSEVRLDDRWRSVLTPEDLAAFDRIAGGLNRRYGYE